MPKGAVVVGVDRVPGLATLNAAAKGAADFAAWARGQGFEVVELTDTDGSAVSVADVKSAVQVLVERGDLELLVVYFAGHGILRAPDWEIWLLSGAPDDPNEAVNLAGSIVLSRNSGVPHVVFISDACRSRPATMSFFQVEGSVVFPNRTPRPLRPPIDLFYAALPGSPALEVPSDAAVADYRGLFTEHLLRGLNGHEPSVVERREQGSRTIWVVPSWLLEDYLEREVPAAARRIDIRLKQDPDVRAESHPPKYLALLKSPPTRARRRVERKPSRTGRPAKKSLTKGRSHRGVRRRRVAQPPSRDRMVTTENKILSARGRESFETQTGFTVVGATIERAIAPRGECDVFMENGAQQIRVHKGQDQPWPRSLVVKFGNGSGTCLAIAHGTIGTILVENGCVANVNYTPSRNHWAYSEYAPHRNEIERRRALVAARAEQGVFRLKDKDVRRYAKLLRRFKRFDLTLGLYAAYAYAQAGMLDQIESIYDAMLDDPSPIPYDVGLLAGRLDREDMWGDSARVAPFCPMLTQGWALMENHRDQLPGIVRSAGRFLLPSLWTTLSTEGINLIGLAAERGIVA